jgi:hypothetical protein
MVETTVGQAVRGTRRLVAPGAALLAVGILAAMVFSGRMRESKQLVKFVPAGVMPEAPADIDRIELRTSSARWAFVRAADGWRGAADDRLVPASLGAHLDDSVKFMHVSAPVRVIERAEWEPLGLREFGLDPPRYTAILSRRGTVALGAQFGTLNPQDVLQYMKLDGRDEVYLMSRFIGDEWEKALREAAGG